MKTLRTAETEQRYKKWKEERSEESRCILCQKEPVKLFAHWKIVPNDFPYDRISKTHDLLVSLRHVKECELMSEERDELLKLKETIIDKEYPGGFILEPVQNTKSIPGHFHLQLLTLADRLYQ